MMAPEHRRLNQRPDTLMQDRTSATSAKSSCNARPDHTLGSGDANGRTRLHVASSTNRTQHYQGVTQRTKFSMDMRATCRLPVIDNSPTMLGPDFRRLNDE